MVTRTARRAQPRRNQPDVESAWRWALAAVPAVVALLVWTPSLNDIEPVKLLAIATAAGICVAVVVLGAVRRGVVPLPTGPFPLALGLAVLALALSAVQSGHLLTGLFGTRARLDGVLLYASAAICALAAARLLGADPLGRTTYLQVLARGGGLVGAVALLQAAGFVPFGMRVDLDGAFATLGNPNFLAGWAGAVAGVPLALLVWERRPRARVTWALTLLLVLGGAAASGSTQWVGSAGASCGAVLLVWTLTRTVGRRRVLLLAGIAGLGAVGMSALGAGLAGIGPLAGISGDIGTRLRGHYWQAAWAMTTQDPVTGVGPGRFIWAYREARSPAAAADVSITSVADSAHNVWLNFLAVGGIPTALAFLAVLMLSGVAVRRLLHATDGATPDHVAVAVAGLAAVEAGYLVQSIVSIEVPSLVVLHLFTAGVLAGAAGTVGWRDVTVAVPGSARARTAIGAVTATVLVLGAVVVGGRPVWAETAAQRAVAGAGEAAAQASRTTTSRAPWEPFYHEQLANDLLEVGDVDAALEVFARADELADPNGTARISAALAAAADNREADARRLFAAALEVEPHHPDLKLRFARFEEMAGRVEEATALVEQVLAEHPDNEEATVLRAALLTDAPTS